MSDTRTYRAARVITDSTSPVILDGGVSVVGKVITAVGPFTELSNIGEVVDLGDASLIPGLFDCHLHISKDPLAPMGSSPPDTFEQMQANALSLLDAGVTTARDLGCPGTSSCELRDMISAGSVTGPRLLCANAPITVPGGHCAVYGGEASGVDACRAMARKRIDEGADVIKVMTSGGFLTLGSKPHDATYSVEELRAIKEEAQKGGIPVTTHATAVQAIENAVDAGFDTIEHCSWITPEGTEFNERIAKKIKDRGIAVCPTMSSACRHEHYFLPWDNHDAVLGNLSKLRAAGVTVIAGTDNGVGLCRFDRYADGLVTMHRAGYTPRELLAAATSDAAHFCRVGHLTGRLVPGLEADLVALDGDPLVDVESYFRTKLVVARGKEYSPRPIEPFGDHAEEMEKMRQVLRKGAGKAV